MTVRQHLLESMGRTPTHSIESQEATEGREWVGRAYREHNDISGHT